MVLYLLLAVYLSLKVLLAFFHCNKNMLFRVDLPWFKFCLCLSLNYHCLLKTLRKKKMLLNMGLVAFGMTSPQRVLFTKHPLQK